MRNPARDEKNPRYHIGRIVRGGRWDNIPTFVRASDRYNDVTPIVRDDDLGLRIVRNKQ